MRTTTKNRNVQDSPAAALPGISVARRALARRDNRRARNAKPTWARKSAGTVASWLLLFLLLIGSVSALGIKPAQERVGSATPLEFDGQFTVVRDGGMAIAHLAAEGELAPFISFATEYVTLSGPETLVRYHLSIPSSLKPGEHTGFIFVEEGTAPDDYGLSGKIRLPFKVFVNVPYPDKYVEAELSVKSSSRQLGITTTVKNAGQEPIASVEPTIQVSNAGERVATLALGAKPLPLATVETFERVMDVGELEKGIYRATAAISFDDQAIEVIKDFLVGTPNVGIDVKDRFFRIGDINIMNVNLENKWNVPLSSVVLEAYLFKSGAELSKYTSDPFPIDVGQSRTVAAYLDARNIPAGTYSVKVIARHEGGEDEQSFSVDVVSFSDYEARLSRLKAVKDVPWGLAGFVVLLIVNGILVVFITLRLRRKGAESEGMSIDAAVVSFIKKARSMGFTEDEIKQKLQKDGWGTAVIERALKR